MRARWIVPIVITTLLVGAAAGMYFGTGGGVMGGADGSAGAVYDQEVAGLRSGNQIARQGAEVPAPASAGFDESAGGSGGGNTMTTSSEGLGSAPMADEQGSPAKRGSLPEVGPSVIKTARLELEVGEDKFRDAVRDGIATAERYGGYVLTTSVEDEEEGRGSIVLRVPSASFGRALTDLEQLGNVNNEIVSGQDVGQEFVDLQARLRNYTAQEAVLLELMERSQSVTDTIRVQGELGQVQLEIERLRGRIRYLEDQTSLGTIEVRFAEVFAAPKKLGELGKAWERAQDGFIAVIAGIIASLGVLVPLVILLAIIVFLITRLRPRLSP